MFKLKEMLLFYYTQLNESELQNDIKIIIQCIPDIFKFSSSEYYTKQIFEEDIEHVKKR